MSESTFQSVQHVKPEHPHDKLLREAREQDAAAREAQRLSPEEVALAKEAFDQMSPEEKQEALRQERHPLTTNAAEARADVNYDDLLATAATRTGRKVHSWAELTGDCVLRVGNVQASVAILAKSGLIAVDASGHYSPKAPATPEQVAAAEAAEKEAAEANAPIDAVSPGLKQVISNLGEMAGSEKAASSLIASAVSRGIDGDYAAAGKVLASSNIPGIDPGTAAENVRGAVENATASISAKLDSLGVPGAATIQHVVDTMSAGERSRLALGLLKGDRGAWSKMVEIGRRVARAAARPAKK
jgi:hypothetical protein